MIRIINKLFCSLFILTVRLYQLLVSPLMPGRCRFYPSCSVYAIECFNSFGLLRGMWLTLKRLIRCRPGHPGGYDPVPDISEN